MVRCNKGDLSQLKDSPVDIFTNEIANFNELGFLASNGSNFASISETLEPNEYNFAINSLVTFENRKSNVVLVHT